MLKMLIGGFIGGCLVAVVILGSLVLATQDTTPSNIREYSTYEENLYK